MIKRIAQTAGFTGLLAALLLTLLQSFWVSPLILQAETFEKAERNVLRTMMAIEHRDLQKLGLSINRKHSRRGVKLHDPFRGNRLIYELHRPNFWRGHGAGDLEGFGCDRL